MKPRYAGFRYFVLCMGIACAAGSGSCSHPQSVATPPAASISRQSLDEQVIEAALVDLVTRSDSESETLRREQGNGKVMFSGKCRDWIGTLNQELESAKMLKSLGSLDRNAVGEAGKDEINRVTSKEYFAPFHPKDRRISLWEDDPASTQPARSPFPRIDKPRPIDAAPPGYADERRLAVVVFSFAWSMHGGNATYVLRFDGEKWHVISRHFAYYV